MGARRSRRRSRWALLAVAAPVAASLIQDPSEIAVGIWILGIVFPWVIGARAARQRQLAAQLEATERELAEQALLAERRRIARDVHDFVGHGLAAVMLQVTSARHVLRRDPAAAEEALRSAEEVGGAACRSCAARSRCSAAMTRRGAPPLPVGGGDPRRSSTDARAGGLAVELRTRGDLSRIAPSVGVALYRIAQEALANAARHAPHARTVLGIEVADGRASRSSPRRADRRSPRGRRAASDPVRPGRDAGAGDRARRRVRRRADNRGLAGELPASVGAQDAARRGTRGAMIRVALVDDQAIVRAGLARILSPTDGFEVVAECADGQQAVEELPAVRPDVIL